LQEFTRTVNKQFLQRSETTAQAFMELCHTPLVCAEETQQALETLGRN